MGKYLIAVALGLPSLTLAGGNSGGTFSTKPPVSGKNIVFQTGQSYDSVLYIEGESSEGKWNLKYRSIRDQDLSSRAELSEALKYSAQSGDWAIIE